MAEVFEKNCFKNRRGHHATPLVVVCHSGCSGALQRSEVCVLVGIGQRCPPQLRRIFWGSGDFWKRAALHLPGLKCARWLGRGSGACREQRGGVAAGAHKAMSGWAFREKRSRLLGNGSAAWIPSRLHLLPCKAEPSRRKWGAASYLVLRARC